MFWLRSTARRDVCVGPSLDRHVASVCKSDMFLLAPPVETSSSLIKQWGNEDIGPCVSTTTATRFWPRHRRGSLMSCRVLNAAARLISDTVKYDRGLLQLLREDLHWLDVPRRVQYKLGVTVHRCLASRALTYLLLRPGPWRYRSPSALCINWLHHVFVTARLVLVPSLPPLNSLEFADWIFAWSSCWERPVSTWPENLLVCF